MIFSTLATYAAVAAPKSLTDGDAVAKDRGGWIDGRTPRVGVFYAPNDNKASPRTLDIITIKYSWVFQITNNVRIN